MSSFDWKKNIEDIIKDGVIITTGATDILIYVYVCKPYRWNLWRGVGERLCSQQKMDRQVNTTTTKL